MPLNIPIKPSTVPSHDISGDYALVFVHSDGTIGSPKVLRLSQHYHYLKGSILTETGDYRYLEGVVRNDSFLLSTMDVYGEITTNKINYYNKYFTFH